MCCHHAILLQPGKDVSTQCRYLYKPQSLSVLSFKELHFFDIAALAPFFIVCSQIPKAKSRHGQPTRIRYNILLLSHANCACYKPFLKQIFSSFDQNSSLSINRGIANSSHWWCGNLNITSFILSIRYLSKIINRP